MGILFHNFKVLPSLHLHTTQFSKETMKVAISFFLIATVFFVNTTGRVVSGSFKVNNNLVLTGNHHAKLSFIQAKIIEESKTQNLDIQVNNGISHAKNLRKAMISKYQGRWFVCAVENDEYYSVSVTSGYKEYLDLTYKGVRWIIFSY